MKSVALEAAENIGKMVKTKNVKLSKPKKPAAKKAAPAKPADKQIDKPKSAPATTKPSAKVKPAPKNKDTSSVPKSSVKYKYDTPAVDLSFDKPVGFTVKDKRVK